MQIPSQIAGVISVAATGHNGLKAYYSNYGLMFVNVRESSPKTNIQLAHACSVGRKAVL